ncbi:pleckstrin-like domain-containing family A member 2-like [Scleropages formosus]|uniref:Pleckstrin-like domain-containing family A member 2-like n=1 Tax=Scleropages formosus TaxID=113540 RepID=A0A0P7XF86_SCLFO|nr:pleckstrin-like domain-containing family A member 2-like [Scleropages formosus]
MPYVDRQNRICGFLDIEENESSNKFQRRYFILDTQGNLLLWYMDNPQVSEATAKQKPKAEFCFVINALSRRYFLQANDPADLKEWVIALNKATKITVPKVSNVPQNSDVTKLTPEHQPKKQQAYKTEIIGGVVVHTPIHQNEGEDTEAAEPVTRAPARGLPNSLAGSRPGVVRWGFCVKQGNVRKSWKRRFFTLDDNSVSYYKCDTDKEPLRAIPLKDVQKVHECLVKSGELLMRDNLFEIITSSRVFYIQTDTPEDMHGWIKAISAKIQELRGPVKDSGFMRSTSLHRSGVKASGAGPRGRQVVAEERKVPLVKSCSVAPSWQPWTPVPPSSPGPKLMEVDEGESTFRSLPTFSGRTEEDLDPASSRRRHKSQPHANNEKVFPFNVDDDGIRTTDV